jgi:Spy/CpxP family protein refolding chaperone
MRLNYKYLLLANGILLTSLLTATSLPAANASPGNPVLQLSSRLLADRPGLSSPDNVPKGSDEDEADNDQSGVAKHKDESLPRASTRDKSDSENKSDEASPTRSRRAHGFDSFRTNPLNLTPLNLTAEQKDKIQAMRKESSKKARAIHAALKAKRGEMCDLMFNPESTNSEILKMRNEVRKLHEQADDLMVQDFLAIRTLLTPEQKKHLPEIKPVHKESARS